MKVEIRSARIADASKILEICRERERAAYESLGETGKRFLKDLIRSSREAWTGLIDDEIVCLWGIERGSLLSDSAFIWLLTGTGVDKHPFAFVRHSQIRLADLRERYHYIHGYVQVDNETSVKWLKWLGFTLSDAEMVNGYAVRKFSMAS